jgi:hypothetical protein
VRVRGAWEAGAAGVSAGVADKAAAASAAVDRGVRAIVLLGCRMFLSS